MPPKPRQSCQNLVEQEERIQLAISALNKQQISSIRRAAAVHRVPYSTLRDRTRGKQYRIEQRANGHRLSIDEEKSLVEWILCRDERGVPPRPSHIAEMANLLLRDTSPNAKPVGKNWVSSFISRHEEIKTRFANRDDSAPAKCEDSTIIEAWFTQLEKIQKQWGIQDGDIFNVAETGFVIGLIATSMVVPRADMPGKSHLIQPGNREWATTIECMNSMGWMVPSCIILKGTHFIEGWFEEDKLPGNWRIEVSDNGWATDQISLRWLEEAFMPATAPQRARGYQLLILDGHSSHLTPQFDKLCKENNIIAICMPPHLTHRLQPLHVGCFEPLNRVYGGLVEAKVRLGFNEIDKFDFLAAYPTAYEKVFTPQNIRNGFAAAGILPLNSKRVLDNLKTPVIAPEPLRRPRRVTGSFALAAPRTARQLVKQASLVKKMLWDHSQSPSSSLNKSLNELLKGCEFLMRQAVSIAKEVHGLRAENGKSKQTSRSRRQRNKKLNEEGGPSDSSASTTSAAPRRAPPTCSECNIQGHTRTRCPTRQND